ncbi:MAG: hypothetical protein QXS69_04025 [Candidatus Aenigmatarchaeota archaeon]
MTKTNKIGPGPARPRVKISLVEKENRMFLRVEYTEYESIAKELERRGLQKYYSKQLFGENEGYVYRYIDSYRIMPEKLYEIKISKNISMMISVVDDINKPVIYYNDFGEMVINMAIFRTIPVKNGDIYVTEVPVDIEYVPFAKKVFSQIVKLYRDYLQNFFPIKRIKLSVEFL